MSINSLKKIVSAIFIVAIIGWISFVPEPIQQKNEFIFIIAIWVMLLFSLAQGKFKLNKYFFAKEDICFWLYLGLISINIYFAQDKGMALSFYRNFCLAAIAIYFFMKNEATLGTIRRIIYLLVISAVCVSIFGFVEMLTKTNFIYQHYIETFCYKRFIGQRMMSTMVHPNILGAYLLACLPLAYYLSSSAASGKYKFLWRGSLIIIAAALFLTYSRGSWIAFLCLCTIWLLLRNKPYYALIPWAVFFLFSFALTMICLQAYTLQRFSLNCLWNYLIHGHRTVQYFVIAAILKQHPFVGIGLLHYRMLFNQYTTLHLPYEVMIPDSIYLMHLAETGLIGFAGLALFLGNSLRQAWQGYKSASGEKKKIIFALTLGFIGLLFNMASFDGFLWRTPFYLFWVFAGSLAGIVLKRGSRN